MGHTKALVQGRQCRLVVEAGGAVRGGSIGMEAAGTAGVSVLEAGEGLTVVGIGLGELMRVAVSVDSGHGDIREIARHFDRRGSRRPLPSPRSARRFPRRRRRGARSRVSFSHRGLCCQSFGGDPHDLCS